MKYLFENRIIKNSIIFGLIYFFIAVSIDFTDNLFIVFAVFFQFLPGLTFPISTTKYRKLQTPKVKILLHILISVLVYYGNVWIYSFERSFYLSPILAGFFGSFLYLSTSVFILKLKIKWTELLSFSLLSGMTFIPNILLKGNGTSIGVAIFLWTILNGIAMFRIQTITQKVE